MKRILFLFFSCALLFGCTSSNNSSYMQSGDSHRSEIPQYIVYDLNRCIHVDSDCLVLMDSLLYQIRYVDTNDLRSVGKVCSQCVGYEDYKELRRIVEKNASKESGNPIAW